MAGVLDACQRGQQKETQGFTFQRGESGTRENEMDESLSWDTYWKKEKMMCMLRGSGG